MAYGKYNQKKKEAYLKYYEKAKKAGKKAETFSQWMAKHTNYNSVPRRQAAEDKVYEEATGRKMR